MPVRREKTGREVKGIWSRIGQKVQPKSHSVNNSLMGLREEKSDNGVVLHQKKKKIRKKRHEVTIKRMIRSMKHNTNTNR